MFQILVRLTLLFIPLASSATPKLGPEKNAFCANKWKARMVTVESHPSVQKAQSLLHLRGRPLQSETLFESPIHGSVVEIKGVPQIAKPWEHDPSFVFRHYFTQPQRMPEVLKRSLLDAEVEPYYIVHPKIRKEIYSDLVGTFLTTPSTDPRTVGLEAGLDYVDFTLPAGLGVIFLEEGIWLIPGRPATPDWIMKEYQKHQLSGNLNPPASFHRAFDRIREHEREPPLLVPIHILAFGKSGIHIGPKK